MMVINMITIESGDGWIRRQISPELKRIEKIVTKRVWLAALQWYMYPDTRDIQEKFMSRDTWAKLILLGVL